MSNPTWERKVYYFILEGGSRFLFADEVRKKHFLDMICETQRGEDLKVFIQTVRRFNPFVGLCDILRKSFHKQFAGYADFPLTFVFEKYAESGNC